MNFNVFNTMDAFKGLSFTWLLLTNLVSLASSEIKPLQGKVVSGLYYEESMRFVPYTKVMPMIFEFKLNSDFWRASTLPSTTNIGNNPFQILPRLNCRSDMNYPALSTVDWYFACPVFYHLHQYLQILRNNYTDIYPLPSPPPSFSTSRTPLLSPLGPQENQKFTNDKMRFDECDSILDKMWKGITLQNRDTGLAFYISLIEKCSSLPIYTEEKIPDLSEEFIGYFDHMQSNFVSNFFLNSSDPGELINNLLALQGLQLQSIYAELSRVREAILSCQNNLIPQSFLKYSRMEKALLELRPKLLKMRYSMSVTSVPKLFELPIADCIFGSRSLIVQVLLPVVQSDSNFALLKVNSPIFLYGNRLCKVNAEKLDKGESKFISDDGRPFNYYIYDKGNNIVISTGCTPGDNNLCMIPDQSARPLINRCLTSVMNHTSNTDDIRFYCSLQCESKPLSEPFSKLIIPVIQRISTNKFIVAVNRITSLLIKCEGKPDEMVTPQEYGAVEISLACGCYLMWHSEKFDARVPCANTVVIRHVVPEHMLNRTAVTSRNKFYLISKLGDRINSSLVGKVEDDMDGNSMDEELLIADLYETTTQLPTDDNQQGSIKMITEDYFHNNESLGHSLSLVNVKQANGYNVYAASATCYGSTTHTFLWVAVAVETAMFVGIALYLYCKIYEMNKKWDLRDRTAVTYSSAAQLTNVYE